MNKQVDSQKYFNSMHRFGKIMTLFVLAAFLLVPIMVSLWFDCMPTVGEIFTVSLPMIIALGPTYIGEFMSEVPVLGSSYYLACVTGNIINVKLPTAINAQEMANVERGTSASDAVAGLAVAASSLSVMAVIAIGALLLTPLQPVLQSEYVTTAANYVAPAVFGYMFLGFFRKNAGGGMKVHGTPKTLIIPFIIAAALYLFVFPGSKFNTYMGFIILGCIALLYGITRVMYNKGIVRVEVPQKPAEVKEEAAADEKAN